MTGKRKTGRACISPDRAIILAQQINFPLVYTHAYNICFSRTQRSDVANINSAGVVQIRDHKRRRVAHGIEHVAIQGPDLFSVRCLTGNYRPVLVRIDIGYNVCPGCLAVHRNNIGRAFRRPDRAG